MDRNMRRGHDAAFKARVALEAFVPHAGIEKLTGKSMAKRMRIYTLKVTCPLT